MSLSMIVLQGYKILGASVICLILLCVGLDLDNLFME